MTQPRVFLYDELSPEDCAMLQALYSRSAASAAEHVARVRKTGSGKFMETYYVGYSHKSIGDCGSTTLFFEGVSELAAKAIQDWQLYNGQQTSTRYIDFTRQPVADPLGTAASTALLEGWMAFYREALEPVAIHLRTRYPRQPDEAEDIHEKAIKARAFDICRAFLPAGVTTQLSWHTNLRQAQDKLAWLAHHPLPELRALAAQALAALRERYPNSFTDKLYPLQEEWREMAAAAHTYFAPAAHPEFQFHSGVDPQELARYRPLLKVRPVKTELPPFLDELGMVRFDFLLDFGSFRDIQRHRHGVCRMPLLTGSFGFHPWYLQELPEALRERAGALITDQLAQAAALKTTPEVRQYYLALGFLAPCRITCPLPAAVYTAELRSGATVHPTLRPVAQRMCAALQELYPDLALYCDGSADAFSIRRGEQDITEK